MPKKSSYVDATQERRIHLLKIALLEHGVANVDNSTLVRSIFTLFEELRSGPTGPLVMGSFANIVRRDLEQRASRNSRRSTP